MAKILKIVYISFAGLILAVKADGFECGGHDTSQVVKSVPPVGEYNALVLVATCQEDMSGNVWPGGDLPPWLTSEFIAHHKDHIPDPIYKWSISNYLWWESGGSYFPQAKHILVSDLMLPIGEPDVNPNMNKKFFCQSVSVTVGYEAFYEQFFKNEVIGAGINPGDYDYVIWVFPRIPSVDRWQYNAMGGFPALPGVPPDPWAGGQYGGQRDGSTGCPPEFNLGSLVKLVAHEYGHSLGLPDKYCRINTHSPTPC